MADKESELYELDRIGATPVKNSGRGFYKGDGMLRTDPEDKETNFFTVDVKEYAESYPLSLKNWAKICTDAKFNRTQPMLKVTLGTDEKTRQRMIVISEEMFNMLWEAYTNE